jgi:Asp-tRNA(Asn)/Glu-tRNA(Gln) amidotransferase A subunit family amidase
MDPYPEIIVSSSHTPLKEQDMARAGQRKVPAGFPHNGPSRRQVFEVLAGLGIGSAVFQRALAQDVEKAREVTAEMVQQAEWISGLKLSDADRKSLAGALNGMLRNFKTMRDIKLANHVPLALGFQPAPWLPPADAAPRGTVEPTFRTAPKKPDDPEDLAFLPLTSLAALVRTRQVSSVELTNLYLSRLKKYDPALRCVVNLTEELALKQAAKADREIAAGQYRGALHGIPWGAKDLIAYPGYKTTWGAAPYKDQVIDIKATVAQKLEDAGAVLVAKLTLGALAMGDRWFGGLTRNPWDVKTGSSGSSAGPASAVAAGLVAFALGSETLGSIVSPCRQCGTTGLRPTFGRVSRHGCMTLAWSMDKIGPIARSVEDCALVFGAIHGADGMDGTAVERPFSWPLRRDLRALKVGYIQGGVPAAERNDLKVLRDLGVKLVPIKLPQKYPLGPLVMILETEAAAVFDDLTRANVTEGLNSWPQLFRQGEFVPAVEYLRANRIRSLVMQEMEEVMSGVDLYVGGNDLVLTNLTGHPTVVLPDAPRKGGEGAPHEKPGMITFTGRLYGEAELLAVALAYQHATGGHLKRPAMEKVLAEKEGEKAP